ncbi:hypothetical protein [Phenylobacterium sp.]|uniref:hypothetical protein n=1 Tax=Phenylobacterium sp. TaxID=1871053 RepID=UPI0025EF6719|nr:hypothetical protein [Phenylobacterium sp.]
MLERLFTSGHAVDLVLLFMAAEFAFLCWRGRTRRRPGATLDRLLAIAPGACLAMAVRAGLTGADWMWIGLWLAASLPFHLGDLARRRL